MNRNNPKSFYYPKSLNISCYFIIITTLKEGDLMAKKEGLVIVLMVISICLISGCGIYDTLYVKQETQTAVKVPEGNITIALPANVTAELQSPEESTPNESVITPEAQSETSESSSNQPAPEEVPSEADVVTVKETNLVSLVPKAYDPDKDTLKFTFTSPLDENGEWQTTYGDAGQYTVTVTASDGSLTTSKDVLLIVDKKEESPAITSFSPDTTTVTAKETDKIDFKVVASDLNKDQLTYLWKLDGVDSSDKSSFEYATTYEDSGSHTVKVMVSDGTLEADKMWSVTVSNVNRKPVLNKINDFKAKENDQIVVDLEATDADGDKLTYAINDQRFVQNGNEFAWQTSYDDAGQYTFKASVSDGTDTVTQEFKVAVENVNRAPVITDVVQK
jgi:hypothetical protein